MLPKDLIKYACSKGYGVTTSGVAYGPRGILAKVVNRTGYYHISVKDIEGKNRTIEVHRIAAFMLYGESLFSPGIQVRHLDGNPKNNNASNLSLGTKSQNELDKPIYVRRSAALRGARTLRALSFQEAEQLRKDRKAGFSHKELMKKYGIAKSTVSGIVNNKTYLEK